MFFNTKIQLRLFTLFRLFYHKINIKISANLGKIIEKTPSLRYFLIFTPIFLGEKASKYLGHPQMPVSVVAFVAFYVTI